MICARIFTRSPDGSSLIELHNVVDAHVDAEHVTVKQSSGNRTVVASRLVTTVEFLAGPL